MTVQTEALSRIQLPPSCDTMQVTYTAGHSTSVQVINLPYKEEYDRLESVTNPLTGQPTPEIILYRSHSGGPKAGLREAVSEVKRGHALRVAAIQTAAIVCIDSEIGTYAASIARCYLRFPPFMNDATDTKRKRCTDDALSTLILEVARCETEKDDDLLATAIDSDERIDEFIELYEGCGALEAEIRLWERYWAHLQ